MKNKHRRIKHAVSWLSIILAVCAAFLVKKYVFADQYDYGELGPDYIDQLSSYEDEDKYSQYIAEYENAATPSDEYIINAADYTGTDHMEVKVLDDYQGMQGSSLYTDEEGSVEWEVTVREEGLYNISVLYYPVEGKSSDIQRSLLIDGTSPFTEAEAIEFSRFWTNELDRIQVDNQGNDIKPRQVEAPEWCEAPLKDARGYYTRPFQFYLTKGVHKLTLVSQREPMVLRQLKIYQEKAVPDYEECLKSYQELGYADSTGQMLQIEAEAADLKSSPMLYPIADYSSPAVTPYSPSNVMLNTIGGNNWKSAGQWIEWEVDVPQTGLYQIGFHVKQNLVRGIYVPRKLTIDGTVPFQEMEEIPFSYEKDWRQQVLGGDEPYRFYLTQGRHTLRLEVVLGELSAYIREVETGVRNLNDIYRKIIMVTGVTPDKFRDYQIKDSIPGLTQSLQAERDRLVYVAGQINRITGKRSDKEAILLTMVDQLDGFIKDLEKIPYSLGDFKTNIGALGTWLMQAVEVPLQLDSIYVYSPDRKLPKLKDSWLDNIIHDVRILYASFVTNYNAIGNISTDKKARTITVWVGTGRDQANVLKSLIDESFTKETGINVNLMLVDMGTLLQATLSGQGPDVAMQVGSDLPMNYAMRGAVADLSRLDGFEEVKDRFYGSALTPFQFDGKCYALPETQTFNMMFYRKDILEELGLTVPETWEDVKEMISVLSKNNMQFGMLPQPVQGATTQATDSTYGIFLYQSGGSFYNADATASALDTDIAVNAFKEWTKFYTDYTLEREFDFVSRFRTGEMPVGIADYGTYNTLQVSAPEIQGLWGFSAIPGTVREDGTVDHSVPSNGSAVVIMQQTKDEEAAWEYLKWWTSAQTQSKYGLEMEGLMGASARYPTANKEALASLPWPREDYRIISGQFKDVKGVPQVPGGYYTSRYIYNAFTEVVIDKNIGPREALMDNVQYINNEIRNKRKEFGLDK